MSMHEFDLLLMRVSISFIPSIEFPFHFPLIRYHLLAKFLKMHIFFMSMAMMFHAHSWNCSFTVIFPYFNKISFHHYTFSFNLVNENHKYKWEIILLFQNMNFKKIDQFFSVAHFVTMIFSYFDVETWKNNDIANLPPLSFHFRSLLLGAVVVIQQWTRDKNFPEWEQK